MNLDPAAEDLDYTPDLDIRDLITLEDVMEEMGLGPNGGLVYCFESAAFLSFLFPSPTLSLLSLLSFNSPRVPALFSLSLSLSPPLKVLFVEVGLTTNRLPLPLGSFSKTWIS